MAQVAVPSEALCPFYGSSHGCPYAIKCELSHAEPSSIELCPAYQTLQGCSSSETCYYRHTLPALSTKETSILQRKHKIAGKVHYTLSVKGKSVRRVHILINQVLWYAVHFIIEDDRLQHIHHQKYSAIYRYADAVLVAEFIANVINNSPTPGKYLSYLKNLIDGDIEPGKEEESAPQSLVHYRDILQSIGRRFDEIPRPINPHLVKNVSRVPWVDFKLMALPQEAFDHPDIYLVPGDIVRVWRPKKFVYHCGVYLGDKRIIHISNGMDDGVGGRWGGLFQSGSAPRASTGKYYDYGQKLKADALNQKMREMTESQLKEALGPMHDDGDCGFEQIEKAEIEEYGDDDDMDLEGDSEDENESKDEQKMSELAMSPVMTHHGSGEEKPEEAKHCDLLFQDMSEENVQREMTAEEMEQARRARQCGWSEFVRNSRRRDLELGYFVFPWRRPSEIVYTAKFLTEIHYMKGQYSVFKNNCEHFALYCCTGLRYSPQANTIEKITTPVIGVASKISSFAGSLLSKVASLRSSPKLGGSGGADEKHNENRKNHPILQEAPLDDGGDEELEKILLDDSSAAVLVMNNTKPKGDRRSPKLFENRKRKQREQADPDFDFVNDGLDDMDQRLKKRACPLVDEYANDEEDVLAESIIMEAHINEEAVMSDLTPGGLTQSEVMVAQRHQHSPQKWSI